MLNPGSVSAGTMRPQDLIPCFWSKLEQESEEHAASLWVKWIAEYMLPKIAQVGDLPKEHDPWYQSESASEVLIDLFDALEQYCPEGYSFGSHPGDGADYGVWLM